MCVPYENILENSNVFGLINETYSDPNVWMTSGSFKYSNGAQGFSTTPTSFSNIRKQGFTLSHLRTWKSWLWKKIKEEDKVVTKADEKIEEEVGQFFSDTIKKNSETRSRLKTDRNKANKSVIRSYRLKN